MRQRAQGTGARRLPRRRAAWPPCRRARPAPGAFSASRRACGSGPARPAGPRFSKRRPCLAIESSHRCGRNEAGCRTSAQPSTNTLHSPSNVIEKPAPPWHDAGALPAAPASKQRQAHTSNIRAMASLSSFSLGRPPACCRMRVPLYAEAACARYSSNLYHARARQHSCPVSDVRMRPVHPWTAMSSNVSLACSALYTCSAATHSQSVQRPASMHR